MLEWAAFPFSGGLPNPGTNRGSPALQAGSFPAAPQGSGEQRARQRLYLHLPAGGAAVLGPACGSDRGGWLALSAG